MNLVEVAMADLAGAESFPLDAILTLRQKWSEARGPLLDALRAYASGENRSPENAETVFFGLHLLAEKRETEALDPLLAVALEGEALYDMIGDATAETLSAILISLYDGDPGKLKRVIEAAGADPWARVAALECYAWLVATGELPPDAGQEYLRSLFETLEPREAHPVWYGWQGCVALLGLADLESLAARAFRSGFVENEIMAFEDFQADLRAYRAAADPRESFSGRGLQPIDDALDALAAFEEEEEEAPLKPVENPTRAIGRNDPCPCGSGKKYKKCCLAAE
jgi:hypothetical protein